MDIREEINPTIMKMRELASSLRDNPMVFSNRIDHLLDGFADEIEVALSECAGNQFVPKLIDFTGEPFRGGMVQNQKDSEKFPA